jgi:hypothetical protein
MSSLYLTIHDAYAEAMFSSRPVVWSIEEGDMVTNHDYDDD